MLASTACGGGGKASPTDLLGASEQLLSEADVNRYPRGSPSHALLAWWRTTQFANLPAYLDSFDEVMQQVLGASPKTAEAVAYFAGAIRTARPAIIDVDSTGSRATVYTKIVYRQPVGTTTFITTTVPRAFNFVHEGGEWRLVDDVFVHLSLPVLLRRENLLPP